MVGDRSFARKYGSGGLWRVLQGGKRRRNVFTRQERVKFTLLRAKGKRAGVVGLPVARFEKGGWHAPGVKQKTPAADAVRSHYRFFARFARLGCVFDVVDFLSWNVFRSFGDTPGQPSMHLDGCPGQSW